MGIYESGGQLNKAMRQLLEEWHQASTVWDDAARRRFEERYLEPLRMDVRNAAEGMGQIAALLDQIRRECR